ncbi:peptidoglycan hydrolase CwlO-like protein [Ureibacillus xyleni]|uniref:Peptidoglycan hydrolase CwlO-like protein n=1 Tax=Ureibacillus xyleni TaxID=614648 RepID=A0A285TJ41_9BACL|nr:peptidoglycan DD-metalloendopeptidase family protein [Ureibacillus xyleni]SOC21805.1 peptidoglycan hydrolase CwlO-like protein [Ureibacillus xyleni]
MKRKLSSYALTGTSVLLISTLLFGSPATANNLNNLKGKQSEIEQKKTELNSEIKEKENDIQANQTEQKKLLEQILKLNKEITTTEDSITKLETDINLTNVEIGDLQSEIKELEEKIANRDELLKERVRAVQVNGGSISYIDVLLGANSFIDFIDRLSAVNTLMEADRSIMAEQANDKEALEKKKIELEDKLASLEKSHGELITLKATLDSQKADKTTLIDQLEAEQEKLKDSKELLEAEYQEVHEISKDLEAKIIAEQQRMAELARQAEQKRNAAAQSNGSSSTGSTNLPATSSGTWTTPANGTFTSGYGWRNFRGKEFHYGVDVANSIGTPIVAAADGVVSYAAPLSTYGNVVIITHSINGEIFTSVNAHMNSIGVIAGQTISKGQEIGKMGMTGRVTGPHLHFELHTGTWAGQKVGHVNPLRYVPF